MLSRHQRKGLSVPKVKKTVLFLILLSLWCFLSCEQNTQVPEFSFAGYHTRCIFTESPDNSRSEWIVEGQGKIQVLSDGITVAPESDEAGLVLWTPRSFKGDFQLEYRIAFPETAGVHLIFLCARSIKENDIFAGTTSRTGLIDEYVNGDMQNYHIACHTYRADGSHAARSTIRKNPGRLLLNQVPYDPCRFAREYLIDVLKIGGRILFYVDGQLIHSVQDKGGFGPVYDAGRIGLWFQGPQDIRLKNTAVYALRPE